MRPAAFRRRPHDRRRSTVTWWGHATTTIEPWRPADPHRPGADPTDGRTSAGSAAPRRTGPRWTPTSSSYRTCTWTICTPRRCACSAPGFASWPRSERCGCCAGRHPQISRRVEEIGPGAVRRSRRRAAARRACAARRTSLAGVPPTPRDGARVHPGIRPHDRSGAGLVRRRHRAVRRYDRVRPGRRRRRPDRWLGTQPRAHPHGSGPGGGGGPPGRRPARRPHPLRHLLAHRAPARAPGRASNGGSPTRAPRSPTRWHGCAPDAQAHVISPGQTVSVPERAHD